jgi:hypothetical protein
MPLVESSPQSTSTSITCWLSERPSRAASRSSCAVTRLSVEINSTRLGWRRITGVSPKRIASWPGRCGGSRCSPPPLPGARRTPGRVSRTRTAGHANRYERTNARNVRPWRGSTRCNAAWPGPVQSGAWRDVGPRRCAKVGQKRTPFGPWCVFLGPWSKNGRNSWVYSCGAHAKQASALRVTAQRAAVPGGLRVGRLPLGGQIRRGQAGFSRLVPYPSRRSVSMGRYGVRLLKPADAKISAHQNGTSTFGAVGATTLSARPR